MSFLLPPLLPAALALALVACGATDRGTQISADPVPATALNISGQWRGVVTIHNGAAATDAGFIDSTFFMVNAAGDYGRRSAETDTPGLIVEGNTTQATLRVIGSDVGDFRCEGAFTAQAYISSHCLWVPTPEFPAGSTLSVTMLKRS